MSVADDVLEVLGDVSKSPLKKKVLQFLLDHSTQGDKPQVTGSFPYLQVVNLCTANTEDWQNVLDAVLAVSLQADFEIWFRNLADQFKKSKPDPPLSPSFVLGSIAGMMLAFCRLRGDFQKPVALAQNQKEAVIFFTHLIKAEKTHYDFVKDAESVLPNIIWEKIIGDAARFLAHTKIGFSVFWEILGQVTRTLQIPYHHDFSQLGRILVEKFAYTLLAQLGPFGLARTVYSGIDPVSQIYDAHLPHWLFVDSGESLREPI